MRNRLKSLILLVGAVMAMSAAGHQETEIYIPIGESPGISHIKSQIGRIQSVVAAQTGFTIQVQDSAKYFAFDKSTKIYLQYATPGMRNRLGGYADCQAGRTAEVYAADDGTVRWVKVLVP
jgi:hypothetical protein